MYIEKYTVYVKDLASKKVKKIRIDENDAWEAHKKVFDDTHNLKHEISKITDYLGNTVYTINDGFIVQQNS
jgi:hypothetical protein